MGVLKEFWEQFPFSLVWVLQGFKGYHILLVDNLEFLWDWRSSLGALDNELHLGSPGDDDWIAWDQVIMGFEKERDFDLRVWWRFLLLIFFLLFSHYDQFWRNFLVWKSSNEFSSLLINSISNMKILKIPWHLKKIYFEAILWTSFCKISFADLQSIINKKNLI